jgi:hypothetical protein
MEMDGVHALRGFTRQPRRIVAINVAVLRVEQIEDIERPDGPIQNNAMELMFGRRQLILWPKSTRCASA